jgi:hypothetical protein
VGRLHRVIARKDMRPEPLEERRKRRAAYESGAPGQPRESSRRALSSSKPAPNESPRALAARHQRERAGLEVVRSRLRQRAGDKSGRPAHRRSEAFFGADRDHIANPVVLVLG